MVKKFNSVAMLLDDQIQKILDYEPDRNFFDSVTRNKQIKVKRYVQDFQIYFNKEDKKIYKRLKKYTDNIEDVV